MASWQLAAHCCRFTGRQLAPKQRTISVPPYLTHPVDTARGACEVVNLLPAVLHILGRETHFGRVSLAHQFASQGDHASRRHANHGRCCESHVAHRASKQALRTNHLGTARTTAGHHGTRSLRRHVCGRQPGFHLRPRRRRRRHWRLLPQQAWRTKAKKQPKWHCRAIRLDCQGFLPLVPVGRASCVSAMRNGIIHLTSGSFFSQTCTTLVPCTHTSVGR